MEASKKLTAEDKRLEESRDRKSHWKRWGPYVSERAWGTVREDYSANGDRLGVSAARSRPLQGLPLERGRHRRHLRPPPAHLLRAGAVEREGPHPEGAPLRPHRQRRQSRRGREGILLLPRQHAHALLHEVSVQVPAGGVPLRAAGGGEPAARQERSRVRTDRHRRLRRRPLLRRGGRVRQGLAGRSC